MKFVRFSLRRPCQMIALAFTSLIAQSILSSSLLELNPPSYMKCFAPPSAYAETAQTDQVSAEAEQGSREREGEEASRLFKELCARCHGKRGDGRGQLASYLSPRPTDLTNSIWYRGTSREKIKRVILGGGGALGKSVLMPAYPQLRAKPRIIAALVDYIINLVPREEEDSK